MKIKWRLLLQTLFIVPVSFLCVSAGVVKPNSQFNTSESKSSKQTQMTSEQALEARILKKLRESAPFPSPKYDSGWLKNPKNDHSIQLNHNVGGHPDRYFVDIQIKYKDRELGVSNKNIGGNNGLYLVKLGDIWSHERENIHIPAAYPRVQNMTGAYYTKLTHNSICLNTNPGSYEKSNLDGIESIRVRIWTH